MLQCTVLHAKQAGALSILGHVRVTARVSQGELGMLMFCSTYMHTKPHKYASPRQCAVQAMAGVLSLMGQDVQCM